ncbi:hypothetical protein GZH49_00530 [Nocardia terpenica]|uniref:hypothetical protein n=1 Tax=Nocardia terpenica TaxID=455432 RepID=UPI002FE279EB
MDRRRKTKLLVFDGGVVEIYDYGDDDADNGPGVYMESYRRSRSTTEEHQPTPASDDETDTEAS